MQHRRVPLLVLLLALQLGVVPFLSAREATKPTSNHPEAQVLIDKAWSALEQEMGLPELDRAIGYLEQAVALDPQNQALLVELADEYCLRGVQMPTGSDAAYAARRTYFERGLAAARKALAIQETAAAHYWVGTALGAASENAGFTSQLKLFPEMRDHMKWVGSSEPDYRYGGVARFWCAVAVRIPDFALRAVGSSAERIERMIAEAIAAEPRFFDNHVLQAEFLFDRGRKEKALEGLERILEQDPTVLPNDTAYNRFAQRKAREHWRSWTGKSYPER